MTIFSELLGKQTVSVSFSVTVCLAVRKMCNFKLFQWRRRTVRVRNEREWHICHYAEQPTHMWTQYTRMTTHTQSSRMYRIEQYRYMRPQCDLRSMMCSWRIYWIDARDVALSNWAWQWKYISLLIRSAKVSEVHIARVLHAVMTTYPVKHFPCIVMQFLWAVYETFTAIYDPLKGKSRLI